MRNTFLNWIRNKMDVIIKHGEYWVNKVSPSDGRLVLSSNNLFVFFERDDGSKGFLGKGTFLDNYKYSHYIPTHQELG